jgi:FtsZ-interacting cell division protein ZipA
MILNRRVKKKKFVFILFVYLNMDTRPEKRKAEDEEPTEASKRIQLEKTDDANSVKQENIDAVKVEEENGDAKESSEQKEDPSAEETPQEEPKVEVKTEEKADTKAEEKPVVKPEPPLETVVPFDRLIVLHLEATCDENPTNPAAVQVTKVCLFVFVLLFLLLIIDASLFFIY